MIWIAIQHQHAVVESCRENIYIKHVFEAKLEYILRFVHSSHRSFDLVVAEIEFIDFLFNSGANVSRVVKSKNNLVSEEVSTKSNGYFTVSAFIKAKGSFIKRDDLGPKFNYKFGKAVGRLHLLTKTYEPKHKRHEWYEEDYIEIGKRNLKPEDMYMLDKMETLIERLKKLPIDVDDSLAYNSDDSFALLLHGVQSKESGLTSQAKKNSKLVKQMKHRIKN